jgi:hypothetical protein
MAHALTEPGQLANWFLMRRATFMALLVPVEEGVLGALPVVQFLNCRLVRVRGRRLFCTIFVQREEAAQMERRLRQV